VPGRGRRTGQGRERRPLRPIEAPGAAAARRLAECRDQPLFDVAAAHLVDGLHAAAQFGRHGVAAYPVSQPQQQPSALHHAPGVAAFAY
jgi:hypothetical protein